MGSTRGIRRWNASKRRRFGRLATSRRHDELASAIVSCGRSRTCEESSEPVARLLPLPFAAPARCQSGRRGSEERNRKVEADHVSLDHEVGFAAVVGESRQYDLRRDSSHRWLAWAASEY